MTVHEFERCMLRDACASTHLYSRDIEVDYEEYH